MTEGDIQRLAGIEYTPEQKKELGFVVWQESEENFLRKLYENPKVLSAFKQFAKTMINEDLT